MKDLQFDCKRMLLLDYSKLAVRIKCNAASGVKVGDLERRQNSGLHFVVQCAKIHVQCVGQIRHAEKQT